MLTGIAAGLAAGALWGLVFVVPRIVPGYSAVDLTAGRFVAYGAVAALLMVFVYRGRALPTPRQALAAVGMSVLGFTGYYLLLALAIRDAGTEVPTLIIGTIPLWVMLLGKPEHLRWKALAPGLALTVAGLALMSGVAQGAGGADITFWRGVGLAAGAMASWTAFAIVNAAWLRRHPDVQATDWANWLGVATGLGALGLFVTLGSETKVLSALADWSLFAMVCIVTGIGSSWLATVLWNIASRRLSPSLCGQLIVSETLFALLYSFAWDGQWPNPAQWLAAILFTLGILASIKAHQ